MRIYSYLLYYRGELHVAHVLSSIPILHLCIHLVFLILLKVKDAQDFLQKMKPGLHPYLCEAQSTAQCSHFD